MKEKKKRVNKGENTRIEKKKENERREKMVKKREEWDKGQYAIME